MKKSALLGRNVGDRTGKPVRFTGFLISCLAAALLLSPLMSPAQDLDVPAVRRELERESAKLNEIRLQIRSAERIVNEHKRVHKHFVLVWNEYQKALEDPKSRYTSSSIRTLSEKEQREILKEMHKRAYDQNPYTGPTGMMRFSAFMDYTKSIYGKADEAERRLPQLNQELDEQQRRVDFWNWQLVAAGAAADPLPGMWKLDLGGQITLVTVYRDDKGRYAGVINASGLEHFPSGATLFSVVLDRRNPNSYSGTQTGYTNLKRDRREDEPLFLKVSGDRLTYRLGKQSLAWMRAGN